MRPGCFVWLLSVGLERRGCDKREALELQGGRGGANCLADGLAGFRGLPGGHGDDVLQRPRPARDLECCWAEYR